MMSDTVESAWTPDPIVRQQALQTIEQALRAAGPVPGGAAALEVVAAFGRLRRMRVEDEVARLAPPADAAAALVRAALAAFDFSSLETAAVSFGTAAPDLADGGEDADVAAAQVLQALALRDQADQLLTGAEALLGRPAALDDESRMSLAEFDLVVQPALFRAVPLNQARQAALASVAPAERDRLWWYARGAEVPSTALDALAEAAELIHCFPEAAAELEELRQAEGFLRTVVRASGSPAARAVTTAVQGGAARAIEQPLENRQGIVPGGQGGENGSGDKRGR